MSREDRRSSLGILLGLDWNRIRKLVRYPTLAAVLGFVLPTFVVTSALIVLGTIGVPAIANAAGGLTLGMLVAGGVSFLAYGVLFTPRDQPFQRRLGISGEDLYLHRGLRLQIVAVAVGGVVMIPYLVAGGGAVRAGMIATSVAVLTAGMATAVYAAAASATITPVRSRILSAGMGQFDPELAAAAPLVYAPLVPFVLGSGFGAAAASGIAGRPDLTSGWGATQAGALGFALVAAGLLLMWARLIFRPVAPRFLPRASEMSFVPPPEKGGEAFRVGRGISALLPRRAAAVWVRDAVVAGRRFPWASRVTWPVVISSFFALARWGENPSTHAWVLAAVGIALLVQSAAVVGLGLVERRGPRWIDRLAGVPWFARLLGRWAWAWELSLWLLIPVALAWSWWSGRGPAWSWPLVGALTAAVAAGASLLNAERKS